MKEFTQEEKRIAIQKAMHFRFACKEFEQRKIAKEDFDLILESGILAPSSYGIEPTRLLIVRDSQMRADLQRICMNQKQLSQASEIVIYKGLVSAFYSPSSYISRMIARRTDKNKELHASYVQRLESKLAQFDDRALVNWSLKQTYLVAQAMMDTAAFLGIDSCAIEGFNKSELESYLKLDTFKEQVSLIVAFGYRAMEQTQRLRLAREEIIEFI